MYETWLFYGGVGALAGVLSGLFGVGGGIVIVPLLTLAFPAQGIPEDLVMVMAIATSLATIVFTSLSSVYAHHRRGAVRWPWVGRLAPGILLGAAAGAMVAERLPGPLLKVAFALFLLYVAARMAGAGNKAGIAPRSTWMDTVVGAGIGLLSAILGIGGGTLTVPYLAKRGVVMKEAVATSSACGLPIALAGALSYLALGWSRTQLPTPNLGYIFLPAFAGIALCSTLCAPLGAKLAHHLPARRLQLLFAVLLVAISARLLYGAWP